MLSIIWYVNHNCPFKRKIESWTLHFKSSNYYKAPRFASSHSDDGVARISNVLHFLDWTTCLFILFRWKKNCSVEKCTFRLYFIRFGKCAQSHCTHQPPMFIILDPRFSSLISFFLVLYHTIFFHNQFVLLFNIHAFSLNFSWYATRFK